MTRTPTKTKRKPNPSDSSPSSGLQIGRIISSWSSARYSLSATEHQCHCSPCCGVTCWTHSKPKKIWPAKHWACFYCLFTSVLPYSSAVGLWLQLGWSREKGNPSNAGNNIWRVCSDNKLDGLIPSTKQNCHLNFQPIPWPSREPSAIRFHWYCMWLPWRSLALLWHS